MKRVETKTISEAMRELARTIQSEDGVAAAACNEAADRLDKQAKIIQEITLEQALRDERLGRVLNTITVVP